MSKVLYCIWGRLRGVNTCAESQFKHLYSKENVDLMICCNCATPEDIPKDYERAKAYGPTIDTYFYSKTLQEIKDEINVHIDFRDNTSPDNCRKTVHRHTNGKKYIVYSDNFDSVSEKGKISLNNMFLPGEYQLRYNTIVILERLKKIDLTKYKKSVLLRSDLLFTKPIVDMDLLDSHFIYTYKGEENGHWFGGPFGLMMIMPPILFIQILKDWGPNIFNIVDCRWASNKGYLSKFYNYIVTNCEQTFLAYLKKLNIQHGYIDCNIFYVAFDEEEQRKDYCAIDQNNGNRYKYKLIYDDVIKNAKYDFQYYKVGKNVMVQKR